MSAGQLHAHLCDWLENLSMIRPKKCRGLKAGAGEQEEQVHGVIQYPDNLMLP